MKIFITGINGFIGTHLLRAILHKTDWQVQGFDLHDNNLDEFKDNPRFSMKRGDILRKKHGWKKR